MGRWGRVAAIAAMVAAAAVPSPAVAHDDQHGPGWHGASRAEELARAKQADSQPAQELSAASGATCIDGSAGGYPCSNVDLLAFLPLADIGGGKANDVWGWTDPSSGRDFAILGRSTGTSFVEITDPANPVYLGNLPTSSLFSSTWRDIKVHAGHAFVVSEARSHGMQVFDLGRLLSVAGPPVTFSEDAHFSGFRTAHNIVINEATGFAYVVGANSCSGGLHMIDIRVPTAPTDAGCFSADGYTHDAQCVIYAGPDGGYRGRELCFASNEDTLTIVDVSDKSAPSMIARVGYQGAQYTHQGWLTEDHRYFLIDDELDEDRAGHNTHTYVFDVGTVAAPVHVGTYVGTTSAIDHNQYVVGNHSFQANYRAGLRILDIGGIGTLSGAVSAAEVGYFDVYPADDAAEFNGAWSNYPFFDGGIVVVSGIEQGLFVLQPDLGGGSTNTSPSVNLSSPGEGSTVSGSGVAIVVGATDTEDAAGTLKVEWQVDGGTWQPTTYDSGTGTYRASWDSNTVTDGSHTITARATDSGGLSAADSSGVTVDNVADVTVHVHDLEGSATGGKGRWTATVAIQVTDATEAGVSAVVVSGDWSNGQSATCTTDGAGFCTTSVAGRNKESSITFTVTGLSGEGITYDADSNHDADGDSDGTSVVVQKPA